MPIIPSDDTQDTVKHYMAIISWVIFSISVSVGVSVWLFSSYSQDAAQKLDEQRFLDYRMHMDTQVSQMRGDLHEIKKELSSSAKDTKAELRTLRDHMDYIWGVRANINRGLGNYNRDMDAE